MNSLSVGLVTANYTNAFVYHPFVKLHSKRSKKYEFFNKNKILSTNYHGYRRSYTPSSEPLLLRPWAYNSAHPFPSSQPYQIVTFISHVIFGVLRTRSYNKVRGFIRLRGLAYKTEKTYLFWIKRFIRFHGLQHPEAMGSGEVESFRDEALNSPSYWLEFA